jgi:hypothetical protein
VQDAAFSEAQAMTQLAEKISLRRIMIVCLVVLIPATGITIAVAPSAQPIRTGIQNYGAPAIDYTSKLAGSVAFGAMVKTFIQDMWKHRRPIP